MMISRAPHPQLRPFIKTLWVIAPRAGDPPPAAAREVVLPTGTMHLAIRLSERPFRFFATPDSPVESLATRAVIGGARAAAFLRDIARPAASVGAQLHPGACRLLFGVPADELAGRHTPLDDLWGNQVEEIRERLLAAPTPDRQLDLFEAVLARRLPRLHGLHPAVAHALARFRSTDDVGQVVREVDFSHRRFIALFQDAVGLTPKIHCRLRRFQAALPGLAADSEASTAELAIEAGYSDQAHFNRDFRAFTGLTPGAYRRLRPRQPNHVPLRGRTESGGTD